jgi:Cu(I)/Ag(I) efflux system membrane protein CusA/SilA
MLLYLDLACDEAKRKGRMRNIEDLKEALFQGAVMRVRPKVMTVATTFLGLLPLMFATGAGADVMKRIAAPLVGGLASTTVIELVVVPAVYLVWKRRSELRSISSDDSAARNENQFKGGN